MSEGGRVSVREAAAADGWTDERMGDRPVVTFGVVGLCGVALGTLQLMFRFLKCPGCAKGFLFTLANAWWDSEPCRNRPSFITVEHRQVDLLVAKQAQAVEASKVLAGQSSMTDAGKRRCIADEDSLYSWDEGEFISEQLTLKALKASEESASSPGPIPESATDRKHRDLCTLPKRFDFRPVVENFHHNGEYKKDKL
eukprot:s172_g45.t1